MQHQLAISPLCQITRYTQILTLFLSLSLSLYPFFLSFALSLSSSLSLSFPSLPLAQQKSLFACDFLWQKVQLITCVSLDFSFLQKTKSDLKIVCLIHLFSVFSNYINIKSILETMPWEQMLIRTVDRTFRTKFNVDLYRIGLYYICKDVRKEHITRKGEWQVRFIRLPLISK